MRGPTVLFVRKMRGFLLEREEGEDAIGQVHQSLYGLCTNDDGLEN